MRRLALQRPLDAGYGPWPLALAQGHPEQAKRVEGRGVFGSIWWIGLMGLWFLAAPQLFGAQDVAPPAVIKNYLREGESALQQDDFSTAQEAFETVLRFDPDNDAAKQALKRLQARRVMRQTLEQVRQQLAQSESKQQQKQAQLRSQAMELTLRLSQEKAKAQTAKTVEAERQVKLARERQLKALYNKGLALYHDGAYQQTVETLQQMAVLDPQHPLVATAQRLIGQAEARLSEQRIRLSAKAKLLPGATNAQLPDLEKLVTAKRMEQETTLKYAKLSLKQQQYDQTLELAQKVLAQDPDNKPAQEFLHQATLGKLKAEETRLAQQGLRDDQRLVNDVSRAELLNPEAFSTKKEKAATPQPASLSQISAEPPVMSKLKEPISFDFQDVAFSDVLDFLADSANVSIIPSPHVDLKNQRVSLRVDKLPVEMALKYLIKNLGLAYRIDQDAILIATPEELDNEPLETRVFFLQNGLGPFALETSAVKTNPSLQMESFKKLVDQTIVQPSGSKLVVDERSGSLIVTNTADNLRKVEQLLSQLDTIPVQVLIESRFIQVSLTELDQKGFESILNGDYTLNKKGVLTDGIDGKGPANIIAKGGGFKFPSLSRQDEGLNLTLQGVLDAFQFESVLHLLEESQRSKTLSAPRVTALNNQPATIKVVDEFNYPTRYEVSLVQFDINGDGDFDDAGETQFVNVPKDFQKRDVGILLNVTPSVGKDLKTITLVLAPEVSQFSQFRDLGGGVTIPEFTSSQLTTSIVMRDGQTVVLGGLMKDLTSDQLTKVPGLGDAPLVGGLFRQKERTQTRQNLLIFVTARVVAPRGPTT